MQCHCGSDCQNPGPVTNSPEKKLNHGSEPLTFEPDQKLLQFLMRLAFAEASASLDESTQVGAVVYHPYGGIGYGYNSIVSPNLDIPENRQRPWKYYYTGHAETNAIDDFLRTNATLPVVGMLQDSIMVATWAACAECAKRIAHSSGIKRVYVCQDILDIQKDQVMVGTDWHQSISAAMNIFNDYGVQYIPIKLRCDINRTLRLNGKSYDF